MKKAVSNYRNGDFDSWRTVSVELAILFTDKRRICELITNPSFHPMRSFPPRIKLPRSDKIVMRLPFLIGGNSLIDLFDRTQAKMPLAMWLQQNVAILAGTDISIEKFIKSIRDQDTAHVDTGNTIEVQSAKCITIGKRSLVEVGLVAIAEYLIHEITSEME